jgi:hypothetical protein
MKCLAFVLVALTRVAAAEPYVVDGHAIGIAANEPLGWVGAAAVGASVYVAIDEHQVIRANFATWNHSHSLGETPGTSDDTGGRYTDGGVSWMLFPRKAFDGPSIELGVLARHRDTFDIDDEEHDTAIKSNLYAGRILVGWSWLIKQRAFISVQVGFSTGSEHGTRTVTDISDPTEMPPPSVTNIDPANTSTEGMARFGFLL